LEVPLEENQYGFSILQYGAEKSQNRQKDTSKGKCIASSSQPRRKTLVYGGGDCTGADAAEHAGSKKTVGSGDASLRRF
jgi:hypothetical protein